MSKYSWDEMKSCQYCIFKTDDPDYCDFKPGRLKKPGPIGYPSSDNFCIFCFRDSQYEHMPEEKRQRRLKETRERASKYFE